MKWISVKDRLPEDDEIVLVLAGEHIYSAELSTVQQLIRGGSVKLWCRSTIRLHEDSDRMLPTHWMPLPTPPKDNNLDDIQPLQMPKLPTSLLDKRYKKEELKKKYKEVEEFANSISGISDELKGPVK